MMPSYYPTEDTNLNVARGLVKGASVRNIFGYNGINRYIVYCCMGLNSGICISRRTVNHDSNS
jgi:hypothetical protein